MLFAFSVAIRLNPCGAFISVLRVLAFVEADNIRKLLDRHLTDAVGVRQRLRFLRLLRFKQTASCNIRIDCNRISCITNATFSTVSIAYSYRMKTSTFFAYNHQLPLLNKSQILYRSIYGLYPDSFRQSNLRISLSLYDFSHSLQDKIR